MFRQVLFSFLAVPTFHRRLKQLELYQIFKSDKNLQRHFEKRKTSIRHPDDHSENLLKVKKISPFEDLKEFQNVMKPRALELLVCHNCEKNIKTAFKMFSLLLKLLIIVIKNAKNNIGELIINTFVNNFREIFF